MFEIVSKVGYMLFRSYSYALSNSKALRYITVITSTILIAIAISIVINQRIQILPIIANNFDVIFIVSMLTLVGLAGYGVVSISHIA